MSAFVDKYVTPTGAGSHTGADWANAWTLEESFTNAVAGDRVKCQKGTYTVSSALSIPGSPTSSSPILWVGLNAAGNITNDIEDCPVLDFSGVTATNAITHNFKSYWGLHGFEIKNAYSVGINPGQGIYLGFLWIHDCGGNGISSGSTGTGSITNIGLNIRSNSNSGFGIYWTNGILIDPESYDNASSQVKLSNSARCIVGGYLAGASSDTVYMNNTYAPLIGCTIDGGTDAIHYDSNLWPAGIVRCLITNATYGINSSLIPFAFNILNDIYNCTTDEVQGETLHGARVAPLDIDPQYTDIANNDYQISESSIQNVVPAFLQRFDIGADQGAGGSSTAYSLPLKSYCKGVTGVEMDTIYPGKENAIGIKVYEDGVRRTDLTALTRCRVIFGGVEVDSATTAAAFTLAYDDADGNDVILLDFGELASTLPEGEWSATVIIYESTRPDGYICAEGFPIRIKTPQTGTLITS